jgi:hypothetical protein
MLTSVVSAYTSLDVVTTPLDRARWSSIEESSNRSGWRLIARCLSSNSGGLQPLRVVRAGRYVETSKCFPVSAWFIPDPRLQRRAASLLIRSARRNAAVHRSSAPRQRRDVKPRMLVNKFARIEDVPLSEFPYWDWLLYPSAYPRRNPWRK